MSANNSPGFKHEDGSDNDSSGRSSFSDNVMRVSSKSVKLRVNKDNKLNRSVAVTPTARRSIISGFFNNSMIDTKSKGGGGNAIVEDEDVYQYT